MGKKSITNKIKIFIDSLGNTLNLWWGDPKDSVSAFEAKKTWDVIALNKQGNPIGLEKIDFFPEEIDPFKHIQEAKQFLPQVGLPQNN